MKLATVLTPMSDENLQLAAQSGVTELTVRCPGPDLDKMLEVQRHVGKFGLRVAVLEGDLPIEEIKVGGPGREAELEELISVVQNMKTAGIEVLCYNFMAGTDWVRTRLDAPQRGGAHVTAFDIAEVDRALSLREETHERVENDPIDAETLWLNLEWLLERIVPVAEKAGVYLAMHPDDPPLDEFMGRARIMNNVEAFERLVATTPSPANAVCFCQGTFAEMGVDIPAAIHRLGPHIRYVHFRDVKGSRERFAETFHDNGQTDMVAAMQAYRDVGFAGPIRPDHVPQLVGEDDGEPGYTMLGRLYAYGYMRGLMQATGTGNEEGSQA